MDDATFQLLDVQDQVGQCFWSCKSCKSYAFKFDKRMRDIEKRVQDIEVNLPEIKTEISTAKSEIDNLKKSVKKFQDSSVEIQNNTAASVFEELRERESRRMNIVIHNIAEPESTLTTGKERIASDKEKLHSLCEQIGVIVDTESDVRFVKRLGEQNKNSNVPRPMLLGLKEDATRMKILECAHKLAEKDEPWASVNIVQDLTKMQRSEEKNMRVDASKKNADMSTEDSENWLWKVVGRRGERRVVKTALDRDAAHHTKARAAYQTRQQTSAQMHR